MKQITLTCRSCGEEFSARKDKLPSFCPACGKELLLDAQQIRMLMG